MKAGLKRWRPVVTAFVVTWLFCFVVFAAADLRADREIPYVTQTCRLVGIPLIFPWLWILLSLHRFGVDFSGVAFAFVFASLWGVIVAGTTLYILNGERSRKRTWLVIVSVAAMMVAMGAAGFHTTGSSWEKAQRANCLSNLKVLALGVAMYADNYDGRCPMDSANPTLVGSLQLLSNIVKTPEILFCPNDKRPGAKPAARWDKLTTLNISYSYVPNLKWQDTPDSPLFLDRIYTKAKGSRWPATGNHKDTGGNIAFNDGHAARHDSLPVALKDKDGKEVVLSP